MADRLARAAGVRRVTVAASGWAAAGGAALMFALAARTESVWMQAVGAALVGLLGISWISVVRTRGAYRIRVSGSRGVTIGETVHTHIDVHNGGRRATPPLRVTVTPLRGDELVSPARFYLDPVAAVTDSTACVRRPAERRGAIDGWRTVVEAMAPFGFFRSVMVATDANDLCVGPRPAPPLDLSRVAGATADGAGPMGAGFDVRGVREWRPGDAARHVHWRTTARTGTIAVLDHGEPTVGAVGVLAAGSAGQSGFEAAVAVVASTALQAVHDGLPVFVLASGVADVTGVGELAGVAKVSVGSWHRTFAELGAGPLPTPQAIDRLLAAVGSGGALLLVAGPDIGWQFRAHVEAAAVAAGVGVVDVLASIGAA